MINITEAFKNALLADSAYALEASLSESHSLDILRTQLTKELGASLAN
jgi:hypothetical protein